MIICTPDMTQEVAAKFGIEPCVLTTFGGRTPPPRSGVKVLADIGLTNAKRGVDVGMYIIYIKNIRPTWAIAPDVFGDFKATLAQWLRYAPVVSRFAAPIFVAQEFHRQRILDAVLDLARMHVVEHVALPMRAHPDVQCSRDPRICTERAERALRILCGVAKHIHLLGPALRAVKTLNSVLKQCERQGSMMSFDTMAYRRAPNSALKRQLGGRWMPRNSAEASAMLEAWLKQALT
jgi:hypothetical protein